jgi:hypothetical protein
MSFRQVINLPNLFIIDIGYGYVGSTHDTTAWTGTRVYRELETLLSEGEFVWVDSAYPVHDPSHSCSGIITILIYFVDLEPCTSLLQEPRAR